MLPPRLETLAGKKLVGLHLPMSRAADRTPELWRGFAPRQAEIRGRLGTVRYSLQIYGPDYFTSFSPHAEFEKWAAVEVADFGAVPPGLAPLRLQAGPYAVFHYQGTASAGATLFQHIFGVWLPASGYLLDQRPHFELLGPGYRPDDPAAEEEIWVPIRPVPG